MTTAPAYITWQKVILYTLSFDFFGLVIEAFLHNLLRIPGADLMGFSNYDFLLAAVYSYIIFLFFIFHKSKILGIGKVEKIRIAVAGIIFTPIVMFIAWLPFLLILVVLQWLHLLPMFHQVPSQSYVR